MDDVARSHSGLMGEGFLVLMNSGYLSFLAFGFSTAPAASVVISNAAEVGT